MNSCRIRLTNGYLESTREASQLLEIQFPVAKELCTPHDFDARRETPAITNFLQLFRN